MASEYRQMLIDRRTHDDIAAAKRILSSLSGKRISSKGAIDELLGRRMRFLTLRKDVRDYINAFVSEAALDRKVLGVLLFGSVARNNFRNDSDIDLLVVVEGKIIDSFDEINDMINKVEGVRKPIIASGLYLRIRPLMLSKDELQSFRPIYLNILDDGVVLFERNDTLFNFLNDIRKDVDYERSVVGNSVVVRWKIKK
jgi:predicted nucleotidyltransferase